MTATIIPVSATALATAATQLREGKLIAFPTETVYGLGADATNDRAVAAIYAAKGRPEFNPLIVHVADEQQLDRIVIWNEPARQLAARFWPGPLTLVLPRHKDTKVSRLVSAGMDTVAVRIPSHPTARKLLEAVALPIAAPSANKSGHLSPTTPLHVHASLGHDIDLILADGKSPVGVESTVLDLTGEQAVLLRPGGVPIETLRQVVDVITRDQSGSEGLKSPGLLPSHYAPHLPVRLNVTAAQADEAFLLFGPPLSFSGGAERLNLSEQGDVQEAAANLFSYLHQLDRPVYKAIAVAPIPLHGLGLAINDRLQRAAAPRVLLSHKN